MNDTPKAMRDVFLEKIWENMSSNERLFFVSADFGSPVLDKIRRDFPDRFVNVGIAEQNLINVSAGLALEGFKVFAYAIAPFISMRCYEQSRVSLALLSEVREMNVNLIGVGAGYSYVVSGPTHQCYEDITLMRALPNFKLYSPSDHKIAAELFDQCASNSGPKYLRFDAQILPSIYSDEPVDIASGYHALRNGRDVCFVATGYMVHTAISVAKRLEKEGIKVGIIDIFNISHFSESKFLKEISHYSNLISLEEGFRGRGGLDSKLFELIARNNLECKLLNLGVEPAYRYELGPRSELHDLVGIGENKIYQSVLDISNKLEQSIVESL